MTFPANNLNQLKRYQLGAFTDIALTYDDKGQMTRKLDAITR